MLAERELDRFITGDPVKGATWRQPRRRDVVVGGVVTIKVQVWDGDSPRSPLIMLRHVRKDLPVYPPGPGGAGGAQPSPSPAVDLEVQLDESLLGAVMAQPGYALLRARAEAERASLVRPPRHEDRLRPEHGGLPTFFFLGERVPRPADGSALPCCRGSAERVEDLMRMFSRFSVGFSECTLDLALSRRADLFLGTQRYTAGYAFSLRVESVELGAEADEHAPLGLPPSLYVSVSHGAFSACSHIVGETRTPVLDWSPGSIPYEPREPLLVKVHAATYVSRAEPETDVVVGQVWMGAPLLPVPPELAEPETGALSLGENVGVIQLSLNGPAVRRRHVQGCALWCGSGAAVPICGSPPCVPSLSVTLARGARCCYVGLLSFWCRAAAAAGCVLLLVAVALTIWALSLGLGPAGQAVTVSSEPPPAQNRTL